MKKRFSLISGLALGVTTLLGTVAVAYPNWMEDVGIDFWNASTLEQQLAHHERMAKSFEERLTVMTQILQLREDIMIELANKRMTLKQAVSRFEELNDLSGQSKEIYQRTYPSATEQECVCRQILTYAENFVRLNPEFQFRVAELQKEFQTLYEQHQGLIRFE